MSDKSRALSTSQAGERSEYMARPVTASRQSDLVHQIVTFNSQLISTSGVCVSLISLLTNQFETNLHRSVWFAAYRTLIERTQSTYD